MKWFGLIKSPVALAVLALSTPAWTGEPCALPAPTVIEQGPHSLLQTWTVDDAAVLESPLLPADAALSDFSCKIRQRIDDLDPYSILGREYQDFQRSGDPVYAAEGAKIKLVLAREAGAIRPINCLEAALFAVQLKRASMIERPTEFSAFILRRRGSARSELKIYYDTKDTPGGKINAKTMGLVEADLAAGWVLWRHLHNHNFFFGGGVSVMGGVCPSRADVSLYRDLSASLGLSSAAITNGFSTIDLGPGDFHRLSEIE